jgi:hypothetical protein
VLDQLLFILNLVRLAIAQIIERVQRLPPTRENARLSFGAQLRSRALATRGYVVLVVASVYFVEVC